MSDTDNPAPAENRPTSSQNWPGQDRTDQLVERVQQAITDNAPLNIVGGKSKSFLGRSQTAPSLSTLEHTGVVSYEPTELVVTVRAGTTMLELTQLLAQHGQMLPFEPPVLNGGTIGGVLACGLSGPARPFAGSARDFVLGMRVINGQGKALRFGGEVMKNVAGYDAARLQVGAFGTLGVLLETSMKVLPLPEAQLTLQHELQSANTTDGIVKLMRQPLPISAAAVIGTSQFIRLSGSASAVSAAARTCGGEEVENADAFWQSIREYEHPFFSSEKALWRISVAEYVAPIELDGDWLIDWAGGQRFIKTDLEAETIYAAAAAVKGHASCYSALQMADSVALFQPMDGVMRSLQKRVRDSFDPQRLFNPGRFHPELDA